MEPSVSPPQFWVLGFSYEAVIDAWQDARLAAAIERLWTAAARPPDVDVYWMASADQYAFRWYLNEAAAALLDAGQTTWRSFVIERTEAVPPKAHAFLRPLLPMPNGGLGS